MGKTKASTKKKKGKVKIRRRIASWQDAAGDDDAFLDAMVSVSRGSEARIEYRLVVRERSENGYTGKALNIPLSRQDALVFASAAAPFSTADAEKRWASELERAGDKHDES
jgi:hypothetical protein